MNWIQRVLRPLFPHARARRLRAPLRLDLLEDRTTPSAAATISGNVFLDGYTPGIFDFDKDIALGGATVRLTGTTNNNQPVDLSITMGANGEFSFYKLEAGTYQVGVDAVNNFAIPRAVAGDLGGMSSGSQVQSIVVHEGQVEADLRFAITGLAQDILSLRNFLNTASFETEVQPYLPDSNASIGQVFADGFPNFTDNLGGGVSIQGMVFNDLDGDGVRGANETPLANVAVFVSGVEPDGNPITGNPHISNFVRTDANGEYSFTGLANRVSYFINVVQQTGYRSSGAELGSNLGYIVRSDQIALPLPSDDSPAFTGYNFGLTPMSGPLAAALANDAKIEPAGIAVGSFNDGVTNDPSILGQVPAASQVATLEASVNGGAFQSILNSLRGDGSFLLNAEVLKSLAGGALADGPVSVVLRSADIHGVVSTQTVNFRLHTSGPTFFSTLANLSAFSADENRKVIVAGSFIDPDIQNSEVTLKILDGAVEKDLTLTLFDKETPATVANFFNYFDRYDDKDGTLFHRLVSDFVIQAGGYYFNEATGELEKAHLTEDPTVRNEFSAYRPNVLGSVAMAKKGSNPDSATSEFFLNLGDNTSKLGINQNGGFTVFGKVKDAAGLDLLTQLNANQVFKKGSPFGTPNDPNDPQNLDGIPMKASEVTADNLIRLKEVVTVRRDDELTFSAVSSDAGIVSVIPGSGNGATPSLDFIAAGAATITVTATDKAGNRASMSFLVKVTQASDAPVVDAGADGAANEGGTFTRSGTFTDGDSQNWTATVDYGDGDGPQPLTLSGTSFSLNHTYRREASFTVTVKIDDTKGGVGTDTFVVTVANIAPVVSAGANETLTTKTLTRTGSFTDPGTDTWSATVDYGDGGGPQNLSLNPDKTFSLDHTYTLSGPFTVTVVVNDGLADGTATFQVTAPNDAPNVDTGANTTVDFDDALARSGSFSDADSTAWTATVNYGDGTGNQALSLNLDKTFNLSHNYTAPGTFTVTVTVNDGTDSGSASFQVTVNPPAEPFPTITTTAQDPTNLNAIPFTVTFTEAVTGFELADVTVVNGSAGSFIEVNATTYTLSVTPTGDGLVTVTVPANAAQDGDSNGNLTASKSVGSVRTDAGMVNALPDITSPNFVDQGNGLKIWEVQTGTGAAVTSNSTMTIFYTGWQPDGTVFDQRRSPSPAIDFAISGLIPGFQQGSLGMKPGGIRRFIIPANLAYNNSPPSNGGDIIFEVKLIATT